MAIVKGRPNIEMGVSDLVLKEAHQIGREDMTSELIEGADFAKSKSITPFNMRSSPMIVHKVVKGLI